ncbi:MAG: F0F1 ATP synthase subunit B [Lachnospiraceae bacterium]|nr:F0F1 ATP synthase subunit B [Lachnospiraceae bacterium]
MDVELISLDWNIVFTIINLLIFYFLMKKFLFGPIGKIMEQRKEKLEKEAQEAEKIKSDALALKEKYEDALKDAEQEGEKILQASRDKAETEYDEIVKAAQEQEKEIIRHADEVAKEKREKVMREMQQQISDLAIAAATHLVEREASADRDEKIMNDFLTQVGVMK